MTRARENKVNLRLVLSLTEAHGCLLLPWPGAPAGTLEDSGVETAVLCCVLNEGLMGGA